MVRQIYRIYPKQRATSGFYSDIARSGNGTQNCMILAMNTGPLGDAIVGTGHYDPDGDGYAELGCMVWWQDGAPGPVSGGDSIAVYPFSDYSLRGQYLGNDFGFVGKEYRDGLLDSTMVRWKLPPLGGAGGASVEPVEEWVRYGTNSGFLWGGNQVKIGGVTGTLPGYYGQLVLTPGNSVLAFGGGRPALYRKGSWTINETFEDLVDFSNRGFGVGGSPLTVWNSGRVQPLKTAAPGLSQDWEQKSRYVDLSDAGNLLVARQNSPSESPNAYGLGVPIILEDDEEATGVDVTSITSTVPGPGIDDKMWIMAPSSGTNQVKFKTTAAGGSCELGMVASSATFSPNRLTSPEETVTVGATMGSSTEDAEIRFSNGSAQPLSFPVGVKVMKRRVVKVKVWVVPKKWGSGASDYRDPVYIPGEEELGLFLTQVLGRQINTTIECSVTRVSPESFESEDGVVFGAPAGTTWEDGWGILNAHNKYEGELHNVSVNVDPNSHINVYLVGGVEQGWDLDWEGGALNKFILGKEQFYGRTDVTGRRCWVIGGSHNATTSRTKDGIRDTMVHEIGHVIVGEGHPDDEEGVAPLPGTVRVPRLMCSGLRRNRDGSSHLLVKGEWDAAEKWLHDIVDTPQP